MFNDYILIFNSEWSSVKLKIMIKLYNPPEKYCLTSSLPQYLFVFINLIPKRSIKFVPNTIGKYSSSP